MPENKHILDAINNAVKNTTDKPTQNIGITIADIWFLVFGGISQSAEKRKLKYSYALKEFENELKNQISNIPVNKLVEPDIQIVAPALEASKYCVEKENLRKMYAKLIASSLNLDFYKHIHPVYSKILSQFSALDAEIFNVIYKHHNTIIKLENISSEQLFFELAFLESQGLIYSNVKENTLKISNEVEHKYINENEMKIVNSKDYPSLGLLVPDFPNLISVQITNLGSSFGNICIKQDT